RAHTARGRTTHLLLERRKGAPPTRTKTTTIHPNGRTDCRTCYSRSHLSIVEERRDFWWSSPQQGTDRDNCRSRGVPTHFLHYTRERERERERRRTEREMGDQSRRSSSDH
ncbi:unnamed protein product, partial [Ectocarpus sp. 12 AP-2014]